MTRKLVALIISFFLASYSFAETAPAASADKMKGLSEAYQMLDLKLNVLWDQKDPAFRTQAYKEFRADVKKLSKQGLTTKDFLGFVTNSVQDAKIASDLSEHFKAIDAEGMSVNEAAQFSAQFADKFNTKGANWTGNPALDVALVVIVVVALVAIVASVDTDDDYYYYDEEWYYYDDYEEICYYDEYGYLIDCDIFYY